MQFVIIELLHYVIALLHVRDAQLFGTRDFVAIAKQCNRKIEIHPSKINGSAVVIPEFEFEFAQLVQWGEIRDHALRRVLWFITILILQQRNDFGWFCQNRNFGKRRIHCPIVIIVTAVVGPFRIRLHFVLVIVSVYFHVHG